MKNIQEQPAEELPAETLFTPDILDTVQVSIAPGNKDKLGSMLPTITGKNDES